MTNFRRLRTLLAAFGAEPGRWPARERGPALALLEASAEAKAWRSEAAALDALLDKAPVPAAPRIEASLLAQRITARPQEMANHYRRLQDMVWVRAAGLAAAAVVGFVVGTTQLVDRAEPASSVVPIDVADVSPW